MISIILYGRNDPYGYNLHKRAALSLNCMAEVLTDPSDEILFVDYNTPDDFPTFPEGIQDTLTHRAKKLLRIFRVRPRVHERFTTKTRLLALEPIARNVAIRRSSQLNRWILSTNTDMIFVSLREASLSRLGEGLAPGFYHTPRIEIPEVLWESLNRSDPIEVIKTVRKWGSNLHLNEIVLGSKVILYDGPGDFQLLLRNDLFENQGFNEDMLLGWHVDSNIAARMYLKYGRVGDLGNDIYGYHCDHTRQVTPAHSHTRLQNDWRRFVAEIVQSDIPSQAQNWGCADDDIEEIRLPRESAASYLAAIHKSIGKPLREPHVVEYTGHTYNKVDYDPAHLLPFLTDLFAPMPRNTNVAWYAARSRTLIMFADVWERLGFTGKILLHTTEPQAGAEIGAIRGVSVPMALAQANVFVFDFGGLLAFDQTGDMQRIVTELRKSFLRTVRAERERLSSGKAPRRIVALNAINNEYESLITGFVAAAATPFSSHMRHGFVFAAGKEDWLPLLATGEAGIRVDAQIRSDPTKRGWIAFGPGKHLHEGTYIVFVSIELLSDKEPRPSDQPCVCIEVHAGSQLLALSLLQYGDLTNTEHSLAFVLPTDVAGGVGIETRIAMLMPTAIVLRALRVEPSSSFTELDCAVPDVLQIKDWIPYLRMGPLGQFGKRGVTARTGLPGFVVFGPYWSLPAGRYEINARIEYTFRAITDEHLVRADVAVGDRQLVAGNFHLTALSSDGRSAVRLLRLRFNLDETEPENRQIETRIWSSGEEQFVIRSLSVVRMACENSEDLLPLLLLGEVGQRIGGDICNVDKRTGFVAYSPAISFQFGSYKLSHQITVQRECDTRNRDKYPCAILIVKQGPYILAVDTISLDEGQGADRSISFEITSPSNQSGAVEFLLQVVQPVDVRLRMMAIEPATVPVPSTGLAAFQITNWLPFMQKQPGVQTDLDGFLVDEETRGFVFWGPYWTLPAGHYEVIAVVVPTLSRSDGEPLLMLDVSSEGGQRLIAQHQWRLGQFLHADSQKARECRLPFELDDDLPTLSRTIEARVSTSGGGSFHLRSLRVQPVSAPIDLDLFCYLTVRDCGVHAGNAIRSLESRTGCIACTPPLYVQTGRYEAHLSLANVRTGRSGNTDVEVGLDIQSGMDILASEAFKLGPGFDTDKILTFEVARDLAAPAHVELKVQATSPTVVSISGLNIIKILDDVPTRLEPIQAGNLPADRIRIGSVGRATRRGVLARAGLTGLVGYTLAPYRSGPFEIVLKATRADQRGDPRGQLTVSAGGTVLVSRSFDFRTNQVPRGPFPFCVFEAPVELARKTAAIQIRIDSTGMAPFLVKSITLARRTPLGKIRDLAHLTARRILRRLRHVRVE